MKKNKLSIFGIIITVIYSVYLYLIIQNKISNLGEMELNNIGDFLAGAFGPLALFWLILGYFQQGRELKENTIALQSQEYQLKEQAQQTKELANFARAQAEAMQAISDSTKVSVTYNKLLVEHTEISNKLTEQLIKSSNEQAAATIQLARVMDYANSRIS
jgi:hypothetical protein